MKVKDVIKELQEIDPELEIILQKDSEGNGYSPLSGIDSDCIYVPENTYSGEVFSGNSSAENNCMDEDEWVDLKKKTRCVVFFPVN